jgi:hypothetical protein
MERQLTLLPERIVARAEGEGDSKDDEEELNIKILWSEGRERDRSVRVGNNWFLEINF